MRHSGFKMDDETYLRMLQGLNALHFTEVLGHPGDMDFIQVDNWLVDAAVIDQINLRKGVWEIHLVFAHYTNPLQFLVRRITAHVSRQKANMMAGYLRRLAAKDQRGTLKVEIGDLGLSLH